MSNEVMTRNSEWMNHIVNHLMAIAQELGVPVKFIGVGEGVDDLMPFAAAEFVEALI